MIEYNIKSINIIKGKSEFVKYLKSYFTDNTKDKYEVAEEGYYEFELENWDVICRKEFVFCPEIEAYGYKW